jgi:hypothetical protein
MDSFGWFIVCVSASFALDERFSRHDLMMVVAEVLLRAMPLLIYAAAFIDAYDQARNDGKSTFTTRQANYFIGGLVIIGLVFLILAYY